jgi:hypothetical protein
MDMNRHRVFQVLITFGVVATSVLAYAAPDLGHWTLAGTIATNVLWIWE